MCRRVHPEVILAKSFFTLLACRELTKLVCLIDWEQINYEGYAIGPGPWSFLCQLARNAAQNWDGQCAVAPLIEIIKLMQIKNKNIKRDVIRIQVAFTTIECQMITTISAFAHTDKHEQVIACH